MKGSFWLGIVLWLATAMVGRSQQNLETAPAGANAMPAGNGVSEVSGDTHLTATNAFVGKHITVGGPLVQPFKSKRLRDVPKRLWHLVNPFAATEPKPAYERA